MKSVLRRLLPAVLIAVGLMGIIAAGSAMDLPFPPPNGTNPPLADLPFPPPNGTNPPLLVDLPFPPPNGTNPPLVSLG